MKFGFFFSNKGRLLATICCLNSVVEYWDQYNSAHLVSNHSTSWRGQSSHNSRRSSNAHSNELGIIVRRGSTSQTPGVYHHQSNGHMSPSPGQSSRRGKGKYQGWLETFYSCWICYKNMSDSYAMNVMWISRWSLTYFGLLYRVFIIFL